MPSREDVHQFITARQQVLDEELRRIGQQLEALQAKSLLLTQAPLASLPAPSAVRDGLVDTPLGAKVSGKKRSADSALAKTQGLATEPAPGLPSDSNKRAKLQAVPDAGLIAMFGHCQQALQQTQKMKSAWPFLAPVDTGLVPDYLQIVKHPMDFHTIEGKLKHEPSKGVVRVYQSPTEFMADMQLVFDNCRLYNPLGSAVRALGDAVSKAWKKKEKQLLERWDMQTRCRTSEGMGLQDGVPYVGMSLGQQRAPGPDTYGAGKAPKGYRPLTFEEKSQLSLAIGQLAEEDLAKAVDIIQEDPNVGRLGTTGEVEVNLDDLSQETQWRLEEYVNIILKGLAPGAPTMRAGTVDRNSPSVSTAVEELPSSQEEASLGHAYVPEPVH